MRTSENEFAKAVAFYRQNYDGLTLLQIRPGRKLVIGIKQGRVCRFCARAEPDTTFKMKAHAIPELLGNKALLTNHECDTCNRYFGGSIENDLGAYTKPLRTFARIRGKGGVPILKGNGQNPWRIEHGSAGFIIHQCEPDPTFSFDANEKVIRVDLPRDPYTPVAVLKALIRIGLTLLPDEELSNFNEALAWVREPDHRVAFLKEFPIYRTFHPGPLPSDLIFATLWRRKASIASAPFAFLLLTFGNEMYQVFLPSPKQDAAIQGQELLIPAFRVPGRSDPALYGAPLIGLLDLTGRDLVRGDKVSVRLNFDQMPAEEVLSV